MKKAMILAAGRGSRMRPLTDTTPKPLLTVKNKPLIVWHLERLAKAGFKEIIINHAWLGDKIEAYLGTGEQFNLKLHYSAEQPGGLETAGGIAKALDFFENKEFLVINGDIWCDWDPKNTLFALEKIKAHQALAWLLLVDNPEHNPNGDFSLSAKPFVKQKAEQNDYTFAGIGVYKPQLFDKVPANQKVRLAPLLETAMLQSKVIGEHYNKTWIDVGTPKRLHELNQLF